MQRLLGSIRGVFAASVALLGLTLSGAAGALTLADLDGGETFNSGNGRLSFVFEMGSVTVVGDLNSDLSKYEIDILDTGFSIVGPIGVSDGNVGDLALRYTVMASLNPIASAALFFNGSALGSGSFAAISEDFLSNGQLVADMLVLATGGGGSQKTDSAFFGPDVFSLDVVKDIQVNTVDAGQLAAISVVDQTYLTAPEPATLVLLGMGIVALGFRRARAH